MTKVKEKASGHRRVRKAKGRRATRVGAAARTLLHKVAFASRRYRLTPKRRYQLLIHALRRPGGHGGVAAPDPIPNSAVKRPSADGTSSQDAGE